MGRCNSRAARWRRPVPSVTLAGLGARFNGNAYVSGVHHRLSEGLWRTTAEIGLSPAWFAAAAPNVSAPGASGQLPPIANLQTGIVKQIDQDPDGEFRVLVTLPLLQAAGGLGVWARFGAFYASNGVGVNFYPEIGDEAVVAFMNGAPPQMLANDCRVRSIEEVFFRAERSAEDRRRTQNREKSRWASPGDQHLRQFARAFRDIFHISSGDGRKGLIHPVPIFDLDGRQAGVRLLLSRIGLEKRQQTVAVGVGQRFEQNGVDHREDGAVCSNPERQGKDNRQEERRTFPKAAISGKDCAHGP